MAIKIQEPTLYLRVDKKKEGWQNAHLHTISKNR